MHQSLGLNHWNKNSLIDYYWISCVCAVLTWGCISDFNGLIGNWKQNYYLLVYLVVYCDQKYPISHILTSGSTYLGNHISDLNGLLDYCKKRFDMLRLCPDHPKSNRLTLKIGYFFLDRLHGSLWQSNTFLRGSRGARSSHISVTFFQLSLIFSLLNIKLNPVNPVWFRAW